MKRSTLWLLILGGLLITACAPTVTPRLQQEIIEGTGAKADAEALVVRYEQEAKKLTEMAEQHRKLCKQYETSVVYGKLKDTVVRHCQAKVGRHQEAADETLALTRQHREMATEAK